MVASWVVDGSGTPTSVITPRCWRQHRWRAWARRTARKVRQAGKAPVIASAVLVRCRCLLLLRDPGCHAYVQVQVLAAVAVRAVADSHTSDRAGLLWLRCTSCCGCMTCNAACAVRGCDGCYQEGQRLKQRQPRQCGAAAVNLFARHGRWRYCEERSRVAR